MQIQSPFSGNQKREQIFKLTESKFITNPSLKSPISQISNKKSQQKSNDQDNHYQSFSSNQKSQQQQQNPEDNSKNYIELPLKQNEQSFLSFQNSDFYCCEPVQFQCANCHTCSESVVIQENTNYTYFLAFLMIFLCLCWVPFVFTKYFKRIQHICPGCDCKISEFDNLYQYFKRNQLDCL